MIYIGEQQPESDHNIEYKDSDVSTYKDERFRVARGWFSYNMKVKEKANKLRITVKTGEEKATIISVANAPLYKEPQVRQSADGFTILEYELDDVLTEGTYKVHFAPKVKNTPTASIFEVRLIND